MKIISSFISLTIGIYSLIIGKEEIALLWGIFAILTMIWHELSKNG